MFNFSLINCTHKAHNNDLKVIPIMLLTLQLPCNDYAVTITCIIDSAVLCCITMQRVARIGSRQDKKNVTYSISLYRKEH